MIETNTTIEKSTLDLVNRLIESEVEKAKLEMKMERLQMDSENSHADLYEAFAKAQGEFEVPKKTAKGHFNNMYAPLSEILLSTRPALAKYGLSFSQSEKVLYQGQNVLVSVVTTLAHSSGQVIHRESLPLAYNVQNVQNAGSILTYLKRYHAKSVLGIEADEEDDASIVHGQIQAQPQSNNYYRGQSQGPQLQRNISIKESRPNTATKGNNLEEKVSQTSESSKDPEVVVSKEEVKSEVTSSVGNQSNVEQLQQVSKEHEVILSSEEVTRVKATIQRGIERAKQFGAEEDQLKVWETSQDYEGVLRELSDFVLNKSKK